MLLAPSMGPTGSPFRPHLREPKSSRSSGSGPSRVILQAKGECVSRRGLAHRQPGQRRDGCSPKNQETPDSLPLPSPERLPVSLLRYLELAASRASSARVRASIWGSPRQAHSATCHVEAPWCCGVSAPSSVAWTAPRNDMRVSRDRPAHHVRKAPTQGWMRRRPRRGWGQPTAGRAVPSP